MCLNRSRVFMEVIARGLGMLSFFSYFLAVSFYFCRLENISILKSYMEFVRVIYHASNSQRDQLYILQCETK